MLGRLKPLFFTRFIKTPCRVFTQTNRHRYLSQICRSDELIRGFITENTEIVAGGLTPEVKLRLLTSNCRFWTERPHLWPFHDPYWAIYWPGGQALSRFLLDHPEECRGKAVLDVGSGCGASAIAAKLSGAARVVANDVDSVAAVATLMNCELNGLDPLMCVTDDMIGSELDGFDLILLGDMFYDDALATSLHSWLDRCIKNHGIKVLIGDPGRAQFEGHDIQQFLHQQAEFDLPESVRQENYGLTCSSVWSYQPEF